MTKDPLVILETENLADAEKRMKELTKRMLVVVNTTGNTVGVLQIFDVAN